jgi:hypothetical protein
MLDTASTLSTYVIALMSFLKFLQVKPEFIHGFCTLQELLTYITYLQNMQRSASRLRAKHDNHKKGLGNTGLRDHANEYAQYGRYNTSQNVKETFDELNRTLAAGTASNNLNLFKQSRNSLMLRACIWNARRASDLCNIPSCRVATSPK